MRKSAQRHSDSTRSCIDLDSVPTLAGLEFGIGTGHRLDALVDTSEDLQLYFLICQGRNEWVTSVAEPNKWQWGQFFELTVGEPIHVSLFDKDDYGSDMFVAGFTVPPHLFDVGEVFRVKLVPDTFPELAGERLGQPCYLGPSISIHIKVKSKSQLGYSVEVDRHLNVLDSRNPYTLYEVRVHRTDGHSWTVALLFTEVAALRRQLIRVLPELASIPFPGKARFAWARRLWLSCSEFAEQRIRTRKYFIEAMLNAALTRYDQVSCETLDALLEIS